MAEIDISADFNFDQTKNPLVYRRVTIDVMNAFKALDKVANVDPSPVYEAYRTIKIGQVVKEEVDKIPLEGLGRIIDENGQLLSSVILVVLAEFPLKHG